MTTYTCPKPGDIWKARHRNYTFLVLEVLENYSNSEDENNLEMEDMFAIKAFWIEEKRQVSFDMCNGDSYLVSRPNS